MYLPYCANVAARTLQNLLKSLTKRSFLAVLETDLGQSEAIPLLFGKAIVSITIGESSRTTKVVTIAIA
jgi:hypothetical protein